MMTFIAPICLVLLLAGTSLALARLLAGPSILDRIIAFDLVAIGIVGMVVLLSVWWKTHLFVEIMLIFSLLGFVGTVAFVCYLHNNPAKLKARQAGKRPKEKSKS
jgi:multicomponent Na+:H+ antiporter subunit F